MIVTDDSPDESVKNFFSDYTEVPNVLYFRNTQPLGTPENWNEAIRKASGKWIKIMHDDDWFADGNALGNFAKVASEVKECYFIYSAYKNVYEDSGTVETVKQSTFQKTLLSANPLNLFKKNFIGNPSCTMVRRDAEIFYDNRFKWVVDFEYYIRFLKTYPKVKYIERPLINVGMNKEQVTQVSFRNPEVEIPENHLMLEKMGAGILRNVFVFDYYWRMYRNLGIRDEIEVQKYYSQPLTPTLAKMITSQKLIHPNLLRLPVVSKILMVLNYMKYTPFWIFSK